MKQIRGILLHGSLLALVGMTLLPFVFVVNNSFRTNNEIYHSFFGVPHAVTDTLRGVLVWANSDSQKPANALRKVVMNNIEKATRGYQLGWDILRKYLLNTILFSSTIACGVIAVASVSGYVLSRYRFPGRQVFFYYIMAAMMFPGVLLFVPSYMIVKWLGLLGTYWVIILPGIAGQQALTTYLFKSFFEGLPEELFESARIDGAGHFQIYSRLVLPLSKPVVSVVVIMSVFGTWNSFMWPFVTLPDTAMHPIASGLYVMATSQYAQNIATIFSAYVVASVPLLLVFVYATKPFIEGVTSGAFKA